MMDFVIYETDVTTTLQDKYIEKKNYTELRGGEFKIRYISHLSIFNNTNVGLWGLETRVTLLTIKRKIAGKPKPNMI